MNQSCHLPKRAGVSFKPQHFAAIAAAQQPLGFFEIHAENYMGAGGRPHAELRLLRSQYALSIHGVGLSIGTPGRLDRTHLLRLKTLCDRYEPESVSEHLAWCAHGDVYLNDLLPLPYTDETLAVVSAHVEMIQNELRRQILIENPATYLRFAESHISEPDFITEVLRRTGCGLLLDINNIFVSAINHGSDPSLDLFRFPLDRVQEVHLAGHTEADDGSARLLIDAHGSAVAGPVFALYSKLIAQLGPVPTLLEWDNDVPEWPRLLEEALKTQAILDCHQQLDAAADEAA
jgi:uncharacterized protein (UPF0276 family)